MMKYSKEMEEAEIFARCHRFLNYHHRESPAQVLKALAEEAGDALPDFYGSGNLMENFEAELAELLGKEAALFLPSGTMAQPIALRIWCDRCGRPEIGLHPTSHLEIHEQHAYRYLHGLKAMFIGDKGRVLAVEDLPEGSSLGALVTELPHREIGGALPSLDDLERMSAWCRERGTYFHLDGARLWECGPHYGKKYREIAALFDSVYVSFYKGLGAIAGAVLAGPEDFVAEARVWQRRQGGNLVSLYPYVLSARRALAMRLPRMERYHQKAVEIASALSSLPGVRVWPNPPPTNMMHVELEGDIARIEAASLRIAREQGVALFRKLRSGNRAGAGFFELAVGDSTLEISTTEIAALFRELMK